MPEDVVADVMAEGVVHVLEVVDVEQHERAARRLGRFDSESSGKLDVEGPAVVCARQRVAQHELLEVGL